MRTTLVDKYILKDKDNKFKSMYIHVLAVDFEQVVPPWGNVSRKQDKKKLTNNLVTSQLI